MQQEDDLRGLAKVMDFMRALSILFVVINIYWFCYGAIKEWGINIGVVDKILLGFNRTAGLFTSILWTKVFAVVFLALSCLGTKGVKDEKITWNKIVSVRYCASCACYRQGLTLPLDNHRLFITRVRRPFSKCKMAKTDTKTYIAYLRQSTKKQEASGLGIAAQREIIQNYLNGGSILEEYIETETGKDNNRPKLKAALLLCRQSNSVLICAKLDRLSGNVAFTSRLLESDVEIVFCDFPQANRFILHIISSISEYEAKLISERTRQSLKARKANGVKLGKPENLLNNHSKAIRGSVKTNQDKARYNQNNRRATALISMMKKEGKNYVQIAEALNKQGFKTSKGCQFYAVQVWRLYRRYLK